MPKVLPRPDNWRNAFHDAKIGNWRAALAAVDGWYETGSVDTAWVVEVGRACLHRRGFPALSKLLASGRLPQVPVDWLRQVLSNKQDDVAAWLIDRATLTVLTEPMRMPHYRDLTPIGLAGRRACIGALDALARRGVRDPMGLSVFLMKPDDDAAPAVIPRLLALGSGAESLDSMAVSAMRRGLSSRFGNIQTPLQAALVLHLPQTALALLEAGVDTARRWPEDAFGKPERLGDTTAHTLIDEFHLLWREREPESKGSMAARALLMRMATHPVWWMPDHQGKRPFERHQPHARNKALTALVNQAESAARMEAVPRPVSNSPARRPRL